MKMNVPPEQEASPPGSSPESGDAPALTKTQATRRRILGAALGAPVIYTLPSGALQAASSSLCESDSALDPVQVQRIEQGQNPVVYEVTQGSGPNKLDICDLNTDPVLVDPECGYQGKTWVYDGELPTKTGTGNAETGRLVTHSCWTSMGTGAAGTNWVDLG